MVQALIAGRKMQTRRMVKPAPISPAPHGPLISFNNGVPEYSFGLADQTAKRGLRWWRCPYGKPGDRLWVREAWSHTGEGVWTIADARKRLGGHPIYAATYDGPPPLGWWPSIHMPREFSRLTLEVTEVRVERLQDISKADSLAEGLVAAPGGWWSGAEGQASPTPQDAYAALWNSINGPGSWDDNPWVWAVTFKLLEIAYAEAAA